MKRITCSLCGGTGVSYEVHDPVEEREPRQVAALEKQTQLDLVVTPEEEEAWQVVEKTLMQRLP